MGFKNPSVGQNMNTDELSKRIDKLSEEIETTSKMVEEILALARDISVSSKMSIKTDPEKENETVVDIPIVDNNEISNKDEITVFDADKIPLTVEASEGMQRIMNLKEPEITKLKSGLAKEETIPIIDADAQNNSNEDLISIKL